MKKYLTLSLLLSAVCQLSAENYSKISSKHAQYNGTTLHFEGEVLLEHELGTMLSEKAVCIKKSETDHSLFQIELEDKVKLVFSTGGELFCHKAHFDLETERGILEPKPGEQIIYVHKSQKQSENFPLEMRCDAIELVLGKKSTDQKSEYFVQTIRAMKKENECKLIQAENTLSTPEIEWNLSSDTITLKEPTGLLHTRLSSEKKQTPIELRCAQMIWEKELKNILLQKEVEMQSSEFGTVVAERARVQFVEEDNQLIPKFLAAEESVKLSSSSEELKRCAVAEKITYDFSSKKTLLAGTKGKKVLLWDERKGVNICADQIEIKRGSSLEDYAFKGIGNVRFGFTSNEHSLLKQLFPFYNPNMEVEDGRTSS